MVSALSPLSGQSQQVDLAGALAGGQQAYQTKQLNDQAMQQNQQQISRADYEQGVERLKVINRLALKVKELPNDQRYGFVNSLNQDMLKSVGIDPAQINSVQLDDQSLDALIAQTGGAIPKDVITAKDQAEIDLKRDELNWRKSRPQGEGDNSSANIREIEYYNKMPEGPAKEAAGRKLGMITDSNGLSPEAIELAADRLLNGEPSKVVLANFGRGAQGAADLRSVQNRLAVKAKEKGIDATKLLQNTQNVYADNRTFLELGAREGKIASRVQEANLFADIALKASKEVPRESFVPWNKLSQYTSKQLSDPKLAALHAATQSLVNAYASAVGGGVMTEGNRQEANRMLYDAQGQEAYNAVVNQMLVETQAALDSPKQVRKHMHGDTSHGKELTDEELLGKY